MTIRLAGCVVLNEKNQFLLLHRDKNGKQQWETPGGKVEPGESDETAAKRELLEEIGVEVILGEKIGEGTFVEKEQEYRYIWFTATIPPNARIVLEPGFDAYEYVSVTDLKNTSKHLSEGTKKLLAILNP